MQISIKLPNQKSFHDIKDYFNQLELSIFHARKSYEKMLEGTDRPEDILLWISPLNIDGADSVIKAIESADKDKNQDRDGKWLELMENLEINIFY